MDRALVRVYCSRVDDALQETKSIGEPGTQSIAGYHIRIWGLSRR